MSLLSVEGLTKHFGGLVAVEDLSFAVEQGEIVGLIGPNGAGKSTVFDCLMGFHEVTGGEIRFDGEAVTDWPTHRIVNHGMARVSQESNPIDRYSVAANIRLFTLPNSVFSFHGGASDEQIAEYAARVDLDERLDERPGELPHADVRRLEIAKALATEPDLLLLDEPFAGMNQAEIRTLSEQIESFRAAGTTIVVVDHNMGGLMNLVDRTLVLHNGRKLAAGEPDAIVADDAVQQAYLAGEGA